MRTTHWYAVPAAALLLLLAIPSAARAGTMTQNFNTEASAIADGWIEVDTTADDNNYGFSNTTNAGGPAGEAGGIFSRRNAYYADTTLADSSNPSGILDLNRPLRASGKYNILDGGTVDLEMFIGYFHTADAMNNETATASKNQLGIKVGDVNAGNSRFLPKIGLADGTAVIAADWGSFPVNEVRTFLIEYDPTGGVNSQGRLTVSATGTGGGSAFVDLTAAHRAIGATFNAYGINQRRGSGAVTDTWEYYIDSLAYAVPEPGSAAALLAMVSLGLARRRR
jgi:hypothetical protein